jgi:hypothetical protein
VLSVGPVGAGASVAVGDDDSSLEHPARTAAVAPAPAMRKRRRSRAKRAEPGVPEDIAATVGIVGVVQEAACSVGSTHRRRTDSARNT